MKSTFSGTVVESSAKCLEILSSYLEKSGHFILPNLWEPWSWQRRPRSARTGENIDEINYMVLSQEDQPRIYLQKADSFLIISFFSAVKEL